MTNTNVTTTQKRKPTLWFAPLVSAIIVGVLARLTYGFILGSQITPEMHQYGMAGAINQSIWMGTMFSAAGAALIALVIVLIIRAVRN